MTEAWNLWEINPPPTCKVKGILHHKKIIGLKNLLNSILQTFEKVPHLDKEAALLSRALYRSKRQFRQDKGMQYIVQIYQCLKRYLKLNLYNEIKNYKITLPGIIPQNASHSFLPTRHMLEWILLRLQAFSKLFVRIINIGKNTGHLIHGKLCLGWSMKTTFFVFGLISRLLALSKFFVMKSIEWYNSLYNYLPIFESTSEYLKDHKFPVDLKEWLGDVDVLPPAKKTTIDEIFEIINFVAPNNEDDCDDVHIIRDTFFKSIKTTKEITIDSDAKQNKESSIEAQRKEINAAASYAPDLGIPVAKMPKKNFSNNNWNSKKQRKQKHYSRPFRKY